MTRRGVLAAAVVALVVAVSAFVVQGPGPRPLAGDVSVYFVPHADDELLSMGAAIVEDVTAGREVHLVLVTDGTASAARDILCRREGRCLTPAEFGASRDEEFRDAARLLGVPAAHVHFADLPGMGVTPEQAYRTIRPWVREYRDRAAYASMSWLDTHPDHAALGRALNRLCLDRRLSGCAFYVSPLFQGGDLTESLDLRAPETPRGDWVEDGSGTLLAAIAAYDVDDPSQGRYAIGRRLSVPEQFDHLERFPRSRWHGTSDDFASDRVARAAADWMVRYAEGMPQ